MRSDCFYPASAIYFEIVNPRGLVIVLSSIPAPILVLGQRHHRTSAMPPRNLRKSLHELIAEPFGPYWDDEVLTADCPKTTLHRPVVLENLQLQSEGRAVG